MQVRPGKGRRDSLPRFFRTGHGDRLDDGHTQSRKEIIFGLLFSASGVGQKRHREAVGVEHNVDHGHAVPDQIFVDDPAYSDGIRSCVLVSAVEYR